MNILISGHRLHKLDKYNISWIQMAIDESIANMNRKYGFIRGYAGMASGVDLWFCGSCVSQNIKFVACIPFDEQANTMDKESAKYRKWLLEEADEIRKVKNSWMVEKCDAAIIVWDGNKGGTHNVLQQLIENKKSFIWINPVSEVIWTVPVI